MSEECYRPLMEGMTWSYSRIKSFFTCPYGFFVRYLHFPKQEETPKFYAEYGKFIHKILEMYYKGELRKDEMKTKFLFDFSKEVKGDRPSEKIVANYIQKGLNYLDGFEEFPFQMVAVEQKIRFNIDDIPFVAIVDYIGKDEDGGYVVVDNKSRELKPRSSRKKPTKNDLDLDEMLMQLYVYSAAIKSKYGEFPKKLCFNCFKNQEFIVENFDIQKYDETIDWVKKSVEEIMNSGSDDFYPNVDFFGCYYLCGFSDDCCYWNQR